MQLTGGIHYGRSYYDAFNASWPFAELTIDSESIKLSAFWKTFSFSKDQIKSISKYSGVFSKGLRIEHDLEDYPPFIVFWTFSLNTVAAELTANGYVLSERNSK